MFTLSCSSCPEVLCTQRFHGERGQVSLAFPRKKHHCSVCQPHAFLVLSPLISLLMQKGRPVLYYGNIAFLFVGAVFISVTGFSLDFVGLVHETMSIIFSVTKLQKVICSWTVKSSIKFQIAVIFWPWNNECFLLYLNSNRKFLVIKHTEH